MLMDASGDRSDEAVVNMSRTDAYVKGYV